MTGNSRSGYDGFRDRLDQAVEDLGGDVFALIHARHLFRDSLVRVMDHDRHHKITDETKGAYVAHGEWLHTTPEQFDRAANQAVQSYSKIRSHGAMFDLATGDGFTYGWNRYEIVRLTDQAALVLVTARAFSHGAYVEATQAGAELLNRKGRGWRSHYRNFKSAETMTAAMPHLAAQFYLPKGT